MRATLQMWACELRRDVGTVPRTVWVLWLLAGVAEAIALMVAAAHPSWWLDWLDNYVGAIALTLAFCCGVVSNRASVRRRRSAIEDAIHTCEVASRFGGDPYKESPGVARARAAARELRSLLEEVGS